VFSAKSLPCGIFPNYEVGRRLLQERASQKAVNYSSYGFPNIYFLSNSDDYSFDPGGAKRTQSTLPSRRGHPIMVLSCMFTIAIMCMHHPPHLHSAPNLILSESLTFSSCLASRASQQSSGGASSSFLLALIHDLFFFWLQENVYDRRHYNKKTVSTSDRGGIITTFSTNQKTSSVAVRRGVRGCVVVLHLWLWLYAVMGVTWVW